MKTIGVEIENKILELLTVLDIDIAHIQQSLLRLNDLREMVVKRDNDMLSKLLGSTEASTDSYKENEIRRSVLCQQIAAGFDLDAKNVTLPDIEEIIDEPLKSKLNHKRLKLKSLVEALKGDHLSAAMLISDCARVNRMLLDGIFPGGKGREVSYSSTGAAQRENDINFMNMKL